METTRVQNIYDDDIELILSLEEDRELIYELISSDPKHYFAMINEYTIMPDGKEIYLPDLLNIIIKRENKTQTDPGQLFIKFKFYDNDMWTNIGELNNDDYSDELIYSKFTERVQFMINLPKKKKTGANIKVTHQALTELNLSNSNISNRNISKMKRFLIDIGRLQCNDVLVIHENTDQQVQYNQGMIHDIFTDNHISINQQYNKLDESINDKTYEEDINTKSKVVEDTKSEVINNIDIGLDTSSSNYFYGAKDIEGNIPNTLNKYKKLYLYHKKMAAGYKKLQNAAKYRVYI